MSSVFNRKRFLALIVITGLLINFALMARYWPPAMAKPKIRPPVFVSQTFFGGTSNEYGRGVWINGSSLYVAGSRDATNDRPALLLKYVLPLTSGATPTWSKTFGTIFGAQTGQGYVFNGISATQNSLYAAGTTWREIPTVGGEESKSQLAKYTPDGNHVWNKTKLYYPYSGIELLTDVLALREEGADAVYTTGRAQPGFYTARFILSKWDSDGNELWMKDFGTDAFGSQLSSAGGFIYATGSIKVGEKWQALLLKYAPDGELVWDKSFPHEGDGHTGGSAVSADASGNIYVSGAVSPGPGGEEDILLLKYDDDGNLLWDKTWGGASTDVSFGVIGAVGDRIYVAGATKSFGAGGYDVALLEVDAANGDVISSTYWGGPGDDCSFSGWGGFGGIAGSGKDIYIVTTTASYGAGGTDIAILRYTTGIPAGKFAATITGETLWGDVPVSIEVEGTVTAPNSGEVEKGSVTIGEGEKAITLDLTFDEGGASIDTEHFEKPQFIVGGRGETGGNNFGFFLMADLGEELDGEMELVGVYGFFSLFPEDFEPGGGEEFLQQFYEYKKTLFTGVLTTVFTGEGSVEGLQAPQKISGTAALHAEGRYTKKVGKTYTDYDVTVDIEFDWEIDMTETDPAKMLTTELTGTEVTVTSGGTTHGPYSIWGSKFEQTTGLKFSVTPKENVVEIMIGGTLYDEDGKKAGSISAFKAVISTGEGGPPGPGTYEFEFENVRPVVKLNKNPSKGIPKTLTLKPNLSGTLTFEIPD